MGASQRGQEQSSGMSHSERRLTGADLFAIAFFDIGDELLISPALAEVGDERELVNLELLVFRGMGIIESPLFEWDISADEVDQPAVLLVKVLNKL